MDLQLPIVFYFLLNYFYIMKFSFGKNEKSRIGRIVS